MIVDQCVIRTARQVLGVNCRSSKNDIKRAFRQRVRAVHPDPMLHLSQQQRRAASNKLANAISAYRLLKTYDSPAQRESLQYKHGRGSHKSVQKRFALMLRALFLFICFGQSMIAQEAVTVSLAWDAPPPIAGVTLGYHLYRGVVADSFEAVKLNPVAVTTTTTQDATAVKGGIYYYFVTTVSLIPPAPEGIKSLMFKVNLSTSVVPPSCCRVALVAVP